ncbi:MAG: hypothetical protein QXI42_04545 [Thermoproteota archaeon]
MIEMLSEEGALKLNNLHKAVLVILFFPPVAYSSLQSSDWQGRIIIALA